MFFGRNLAAPGISPCHGTNLLAGPRGSSSDAACSASSLRERLSGTGHLSCGACNCVARLSSVIAFERGPACRPEYYPADLLPRAPTRRPRRTFGTTPWRTLLSEAGRSNVRNAGAGRTLANVCRERTENSEVFENKRKNVAGTTGLEPATSDVTGRRSNQLNYVPAMT
jgi:hypothetical protein